MLSDSDLKEIKNAATNEMNHCLGYNKELDLSRLVQSVVNAIAAAIEQYDLHTRS